MYPIPVSPQGLRIYHKEIKVTRSFLYPLPHSFLVYMAGKRISVSCCVSLTRTAGALVLVGFQRLLIYLIELHTEGYNSFGCHGFMVSLVPKEKISSEIN